VLVRIKASGVNPLDTKIRAGKASHAKRSLPAVLGVDMAGIVEEIGSGATAPELSLGSSVLYLWRNYATN
jgi:NADPH:quinone reductase